MAQGVKWVPQLRGMRSNMGEAGGGAPGGHGVVVADEGVGVGERASTSYQDLNTSGAALRSGWEVRKWSTLSRMFSRTWSGRHSRSPGGEQVFF